MEGLYKWLANVLDNGLKKVIKRKFVEGKQILSATLVANEAINPLFEK